MDDLQRRRRKGESRNSSSQNLTTEISSVSAHTRPESASGTALQILHHILDFLSTTVLLGLGTILPDLLKDATRASNMGKKFDPERDIGSLEGKVILVTGGMQPPYHPLHFTHPILTLMLQVTPA
jgi:hypothetical protein